MKHVFYFFSIIPLLWEMHVLQNPKIIHNKAKAMKLKTKWEEHEDIEKGYILWKFLHVLWLFSGLFTFQWILFIFLLALSFIPNKHYIQRWVMSLISLLVVLFILFNAYHLHINPTAYLFGSL